MTGKAGKCADVCGVGAAITAVIAIGDPAESFVEKDIFGGVVCRVQGDAFACADGVVVNRCDWRRYHHANGGVPA